MSSIDGAIEVVDFDLPCIACGYNLRTQSAQGRCPECGMPVGYTLTRSMYAWNRASVRQLSSALGLMVAANVIPLISLGCVLLLTIVSSAGAAVLVLLLALCAAMFLHLRAAYTMTHLPMGKDFEDMDGLLRGCAATGLAATCLLLLLGLAAAAEVQPQLLLPLVSLLSPAIGGYVTLVGRRLTRLCVSAGLDGLAHGVRWTVYVLGAALLTTTTGIAVMAVSIGTRDVGGTPFGGLLVILGLLGTLIFYVPATVVLIRLRRRVEQAHQAILTRYRADSVAIDARAQQAMGPPDSD